MSCKSCIGTFFGILGSNIFFLALLAMAVAVFTQNWTVSHQRDVSVAGVPTDADLTFGIFDMSARIGQAGQVVWSQYSYSWCNDKEIKNPLSPWTAESTYCNLLLTAQGCSILCLCTGLTAGVIAAFLTAGVITEKAFSRIARTSSFFMLVEFLSCLVTFACWFMLHTHINRDLDTKYPGLEVKPSFSAALAVLCSGLVLLGFLTTTVIGKCAGKGSTPAAAIADDDEEVGQKAPPAVAAVAEEAKSSQ